MCLRIHESVKGILCIDMLHSFYVAIAAAATVVVVHLNNTRKHFKTSPCDVGFQPKSAHKIGRYLHICVFYLYNTANTHDQPTNEYNNMLYSDRSD